MNGGGRVDDGQTERARRDTIARELMMNLAVHGGREGLKVTAPDGTKPIMVAFHHELISAVMQRIAWTEGYANLFVAYPDGRIELSAVLPADSALLESMAEQISADEIHNDASIGVLLDVARNYAAGVRVPIRMPLTEADVTPLGEYAAR